MKAGEKTQQKFNFKIEIYHSKYQCLIAALHHEFVSFWVFNKFIGVLMK